MRQLGHPEGNYGLTVHTHRSPIVCTQASQDLKLYLCRAACVALNQRSQLVKSHRSAMLAGTDLNVVKT